MYAFTINKYINTKVLLVFGTGVERTERGAEGLPNPAPAQGQLLGLEGCSTSSLSCVLSLEVQEQPNQLGAPQPWHWE